MTEKEELIKTILLPIGICDKDGVKAREAAAIRVLNMNPNLQDLVSIIYHSAGFDRTLVKKIEEKYHDLVANTTGESSLEVNKKVVKCSICKITIDAGLPELVEVHQWHGTVKKNGISFWYCPKHSFTATLNFEGAS